MTTKFKINLLKIYFKIIGIKVTTKQIISLRFSLGKEQWDKLLDELESTHDFITKEKKKYEEESY